ncbi:sulfotransferase [Novosphingobium tardum]|uniref:Sulfotransferase n=1 Tax=Novosphingobium tardum TaxID=1538021 RepID=A0ABV8RLC8_9SPHN
MATSPPSGAESSEGDVPSGIDAPKAWRRRARLLRERGDTQGGRAAELRAIEASTGDPLLQSAAMALVENRLSAAEPLLRSRLKEDPFDVAAIRMLAEVAGRIGRYRDAEALLRRALELAPAFAPARANLATALHRQGRTTEALAELDRLEADMPGSTAHANLRAAVLSRAGAFEEAILLYEDVLARAQAHPKIWMSYGHALKTVGRQDESIAAYRRAVALMPSFGEAWWSLANLKTVRLGRDDVAAMQAALDALSTSADDRFHLNFALAKALDDQGAHAESFDHYAQANRLRRELLPYSAAVTTGLVDSLIATFTPQFFAEREGHGCPASDPIFIVGLPRSGSTLIEQILATHSEIEGTAELPDMPQLVAELGKRCGYPEGLGLLSSEELRDLGLRYLEGAATQRRDGKPRFVDKLPNNWQHIGLIRLIVPNARIIDARRHPLDCGWSNFRQHFARGQAFSYDLSDIGAYYADYVRWMAHLDQAMPGAVHRVYHEALLDDPEGQVRSLLAALDLPFEDACLRFHENPRAVRTASSEQVRRPLNRDGVGQWRPVADRLGPLKVALGTALTDYPYPG